jgi:hypothetical protein
MASSVYLAAYALRRQLLLGALLVSFVIESSSVLYLARAATKVPARLSGSKRTFRSFSDIHVWAWHGIYHQALEIARVLRPYFNVTVRFQARSPGDLPRLHRAPSATYRIMHAWAHAERCVAAALFVRRCLSPAHFPRPLARANVSCESMPPAAIHNMLLSW